MSDPVLILEIEFTAGTWTAVSSYLRKASTRRGKQRGLDKVNPGRMTVFLANEDRRFDPSHTGSPYVGNVTPGKSIRLKVTWNAVTYTVFTGTIERIIQLYEAPRKATAVMECADGLARLAAAIIKSPWIASSRQLNLNAWYRFDEKAGTIAFDSSGHNRHGSYTGAPVYGETTLFPEFQNGVLESGNSVLFPVGVNYMLTGAAAMPLVAPWTVSFIFKMAAKPSSAGQYVLYDTRTPKGFAISISPSTGTLTASVTKEDNSVGATVTLNVNMCDGVARLVHVVAVSGSTLKIYAGQTDYSTSASGTYHTTVSSSTVVGNIPYQAMWIDELMFMPVALTAADILKREDDYYAWQDDTLAKRVNRILDYLGWTAGRSLTTDVDTFFAETGMDQTALSHLQAIETTMEARMWVKPDGTLKILSRNEHAASPYTVSQGTFGDGSGELQYVQSGDPTYDYELVTNVVRRRHQRTGTVTEAADLISAYLYETRDATPIADVESLYSFLTYEYTLAQYRLQKYANPLVKVSSLKVDPYSDPANLFPEVLTRDLADRVTYKRRPQNVGSAISLPVIVEGISHDIGPKSWLTTYDLDPTYA